jgi:hypothetical protein
MEDKKLEQRLEDFSRIMGDYGFHYEGDPDMSEKRIDIYTRWLSEIDTNLKQLSGRLNERELSSLLEAVEGVSSMKYFVFGTDYGTGYGIRPVLEITRNVLERFDRLKCEESRVAYVSALGEVYKKTREQADPKYHYDGKEDKKFNGYVLELNKMIDEKPNDIIGVISEFMQKYSWRVEDDE